MANRLDVKFISLIALALLAADGVFSAAVAQTTPAPTFRGRVIDAGTGQGIAGAHVLGRYESSYGPHNQSSCPWMEAATTDAEGWFDLPVYARYGSPSLEGFSPGYVRARTKRTARADIKQGRQVWYVAILESDDGREFIKIVGREPGAYKTQQEAETASREWTDRYLRRARASEDDYVDELQRLTGRVGCSRTRSAAQVHAFLDAIYQEEVKVGAPEGNLEYARRRRANVPSKNAEP